MFGLQVQCSSFSPKSPRRRAKRVPQQAGQQQTPGSTDRLGVQALSVTAESHPRLGAQSTHYSGSALGFPSTLLPDLVARACCGNACWSGWMDTMKGRRRWGVVQTRKVRGGLSCSGTGSPQTRCTLPRPLLLLNFFEASIPELSPLGSLPSFSTFRLKGSLSARCWGF